MKKEAMFQLASFGVKTKLAMMERELRELFRDFPDAFASATPPVLLRPERKTNGNDWPTIPTSADDTVVASETPQAKGWTPARRAKHARFMKSPAGRARTAKMIAARKKRGQGKATGQKINGAMAKRLAWGGVAWQRAHDYLASLPDRTATTNEIMKGAKINSQATFITSVYDAHKDLFARVGKGKYKLKKTVEH